MGASGVVPAAAAAEAMRAPTEARFCAMVAHNCLSGYRLAGLCWQHMFTKPAFGMCIYGIVHWRRRPDS